MNTENDLNERPTILAVDDVPDNLSLLVTLLKDKYRIKVASCGEKALRIARSEKPPDLILLDIMMPGMDGYEVCRQLKTDTSTRDIPVIFLTAKNDPEDEQRGLELGAMDYITKPFSPPIVMARILNHLKLKKLNDHLSDLVDRRTRELEEAYNRLKAIDAASQNYLRTISHELRTPANGVLGIGQLALDEIKDENLRAEYKDLFSRSSDRLITSIKAVLQLADLQSGCAKIDTAPVDFGEVAEECETSLRKSFLEKNLSFIFQSTKPGFVLGNEELLRQSVTTLLKAVEKMATSGTSVTVHFGEDESFITLHVIFQTIHLSDELQKSFFSTFSYDRTCSYVEDLGLALPLAAEVVRAMGGEVGLKKTGSVAEIYLTLLKGKQVS